MKLFVRDSMFYKVFFRLTLTIALQNVIVFGVNLADNIMLGAYSQNALSGSALVNQIQYLLQMLIMGVSEGVVLLGARSWGRKETAPIRRLSGMAMFFALIIAGAMMCTAILAPHWLLSLFSNDEAVIGEGMKYLGIICFSYLFFAATNVLIATMRSVESVRIGFIVSLSTLCINVCLNYILIYGNFGAPCLGVRGAAIATFISRITETAIMIFYVSFIDKKVHLRLRDFFTLHHFKDAIFKSYVKVGSPVLISNAIWGLAMSVQTAILGHMGAQAIAANSIATTVFQVLSVITYGSASASGVQISKTIGEGSKNLVKSYAVTMQMLFLIIGIFTGTMLFIFKDIIINFYTLTDEARLLTLQFMTILSVTVVGTSYQMSALTGIVRGGGDTKFVLINDLIFMWGIVLPSSAICAYVFNLSPVIVFMCLKSDQILKCFVAVIKVNRFKWIKENI